MWIWYLVCPSFLFDKKLMIRIVEMAAEFPKVSCLGVDLAPNWAGRPEVPSNAKFEQCNAVEGIPYPDNTFDVVHSRLLVSGVSHFYLAVLL
jgi:hypothetical protein